MNADLLKTAQRAARAGADVLESFSKKGITVRNKRDFDFVTEADIKAQDAVLKVIARDFPRHEILAEESDSFDAGLLESSPALWVVDPLDGTTNFFHGFPHYAVSVAVMAEGVLEAGVVLDVTRGEEFSARAGAGAWLNGRPMSVSRGERLERALLATGFPFRDKERLDEYLSLFKDIFSKVAGVRRAGAAALDLAYVAAGRVEGFWEMRLAPWDMAAGALLVAEAGGIVTDFSGGEQYLSRGDIVAAGPGLHSFLRQSCGRRFPRG